MGPRIAAGKSELLHLAVGEEGSAGSGALGGGTRGTGARIARRRLEILSVQAIHQSTDTYRLAGFAMPPTLPLLSLPNRLLFSDASFMPTLVAR